MSYIKKHLESLYLKYCTCGEGINLNKQAHALDCAINKHCAVCSAEAITDVLPTDLSKPEGLNLTLCPSCKEEYFRRLLDKRR